MQSVVASLTTTVPFVVLVLPLSNFILDTLATLIRRLWKGEKWYRAHRSHFYQRLTSMGMSHRKVTILELLAVAACCMAAGMYIRFGALGQLVIVAAVLAGFIAAGFWVSEKERAR